MDTGSLHWETAFPLVTGRFVLYDLLKVLGITWLIMGVVFGVIVTAADGPGSALALVGIMTAIIGGLGLLMAAIMIVFFGNRYPARFTLSQHDVLMESASRRAEAANKLAIIVGVLARSMSTLAAGLLARSQQAVGMTWHEVRRINEHPDQNVISLMNGWRVVIRLYCTPENYDQVRAFVRDHARGLK